jgi:hypothetical protein
VIAAELQKDVMGSLSWGSLNSMAHLALLYIKDRRWKEAEEAALQAFEGRKTTRGVNDPLTLATEITLGSIYVYQKRYTEAMELQEHVLQTSKKVFGKKTILTYTSMANLAVLYAE